MKATITLEIGSGSKGKEKLAELFKVEKALASKTVLSLSLTNETADFPFNAAAEDIGKLEVADGKLAEVTLQIDAPSAGRLFNRSVQAFTKCGLSLDCSAMPWEAEEGIVSLTGDLTGDDAPYLTEALYRLSNRANRALSHTQHPLTSYDLRQAMGLIYDIQQGFDEAKAVNDWFNQRELAILEAEKAIKAKAKAAKPKLGPKPKDPEQDPERLAEEIATKADKAKAAKAKSKSKTPKPKAKPNAKAPKAPKAPKAATLTPIEAEEDTSNQGE